tara:strand:- start:959 stop:1588 length:630 start_codon:yes stop_codon:yes gene_type:complete
MSTKSILKQIFDENLIDAQKEIHSLLLVKVGDALQQFKEDYIPYVYSDSVGVAGIAEAKKKAKVTDKDNDSEDDSGETLDPVGKGDSDVDNDGDSDSSDDYIKNRRKAIGKAIDKEDDEDEDDEVDEGKIPPQFLKKKNGKNGNGENGNGDEDEDDVKEEVEISERGDARVTHIYGIERSKYAAMTDQQKNQIKAKYYSEVETAQRERT